MRLIDADVLKESLKKVHIVIDEDVLECETIHDELVYLLERVEVVMMKKIAECPTAIEIVRCKDCKHSEVDWPWTGPDDEVNYCNQFCRGIQPNGFCSEGEKK